MPSNECLNVGEVALAYGLSAEAVGEGARGELRAPSDDGAGAEAFGCVAGQFRLDAVNLGLWAEPLDGGGDAGEQSAARDGDEDEVDAGQGFDDFETAGSLAGDDLLVVVGRDDDIAMLADEFVDLARRSEEARPTSTISAPKEMVAARLMAGALEGITMTAFAPTSRAT